MSSFSLSIACIEMSTCVAHWLIYDHSYVYVCSTVAFDWLLPTTTVVDENTRQLVVLVFVCLDDTFAVTFTIGSISCFSILRVLQSL